MRAVYHVGVESCIRISNRTCSRATPPPAGPHHSTLLHSACRHGQTAVALLLLDRGFHAQIPPHLWRNFKGRDPFLEACCGVAGQQKVCVWGVTASILWSPIVVRYHRLTDPYQPIFHQPPQKNQHAPFTNDRLIKRLVAHPSFHHAIDLQDSDAGRTALWFTCYGGNRKLARLLLRAGADPTLASFSPPPPEAAAAPTRSCLLGSGGGNGKARELDATAGSTPVEVLRRRHRARGFIRLVEVR